MSNPVKVGDFCPDEACDDYGKVQSESGQKNIKKYGKTKAGRQRYHCKSCHYGNERDNVLWAAGSGKRYYRNLSLAGRRQPDQFIDTGQRIQGRYNPGLAASCRLNDPKRLWEPRTPAMAAGLTDHVWTVKELLLSVFPPSTNNTL